MIILGIETSCDETAAAVVKISASGKPSTDKGVTILSNVIASSAALQAKYGGVIPEQAAREQIKSIIPVIREALVQSNLYPPSSKHHLPSSIIHPPAIDAIAVTYGPGLIGSLLVGVETAKTLATVWKKPLIPVNHLLGHFYANWISPFVIPSVSEESQDLIKIAASPTAPRNDSFKEPTFPCLGLLVSGGHTDLVLFKDHGKYEYLGGTRDDAAGECFDKCARLLNLPYPGGPEIAKLALQGDTLRFNLPRPMINSKDFDFSFSGLKTAVSNLLKNEGALSPNAANSRLAKGERIRGRLRRPQDACVSEQVSGSADRNTIQDLAASIEQAIIDVLIAKTLKAAQKYKVKEIIVAGGVAANQKLASDLKLEIRNLKWHTPPSEAEINLHIPSANLCTDNAAMIAAAAFFNNQPVDPLTLQANPNLSL
ncbi:tRNA (adenosine(37)-N6)-threonylcarbamoyltransferase complex transferase subunit TsaD [Candidatus Daviesbacteria bacterium RIFCSPHIGHO2_02_FULL_41_10]|uniref:tRNA N6-adenosine threonylcarbamoyltransferase n=2 Tax=Candidatus Daviesiibacteriota TaxID=1752718 RepID=A0A1F5IQK1_9BACT|nr:MAG: tRNA (adenosine(37)-N6)-threonylcarbamoyltransferase complex transferase subunit TsaD [Candidatus Daviesbacteria bacterium RIFCSPHIGHO2_01_FULL_41_23]OGE33882.1 MAG: tRNA (adenosine(37)-N6)-threonylcarbamoyltransferase complex transferase subunit TsaD [Candidatus Daviesbacteria bacterium RIFCSPHIGHO2_02_FULL_41_10]OGE62287.1 MAG: tRNA (adenosine(37)-N6)-threonylcarbamoyltransferase complex transferase subunit TsaD [Candidatus Daviesbacteria bacterium RIFCSPLOWO2_01_FULL_41_32]